MKRLAAILAAMSLITALFGCTKAPEYSDLDSFFALLGKTCSEAGIDETTVEYFQNAPSYAPVKGKLFGVRVSGVVFFAAPTPAPDSAAASAPSDTPDSAAPTDAYVISRVSLETKSLTFDECKANLTDLFGDPVSSDMTPYIPSKGAVTEFRYESEKGSVTVSHASEQKTVKIEMIP